MKSMISIITLSLFMSLAGACSDNDPNDDNGGNGNGNEPNPPITEEGNYVLVSGGTFTMGSAASEEWRGVDENQRQVTVSNFYIGKYEVTQREYGAVMGNNPSSFNGDNFPVENVTWFDALRYCNALSEQEELTPVYQININNSVTWNRAANGYRLPTEAEWEYAARAGTASPFSSGGNITTGQANWYGNYPYVEGTPGTPRYRTVAVNEFAANPWGLHNIHGNVSEWCWDVYGEYASGNQDNPTGQTQGNYRVVRGGGWNDVAKHLRSAYRSAAPADYPTDKRGFRVTRNSGEVAAATITSPAPPAVNPGNRVLIAYFSQGGNTRGIANRIRQVTGYDVHEMQLQNNYSGDLYAQALQEQKEYARPPLRNRVENMEQYDVILLGHPNWWAMIPMPVCTFLESYDLSGKTIIPFVSHGNGRLGQTVSSIAKSCPNSAIRPSLSVTYSGGSGLNEQIDTWLRSNGLGR